jgi:uncharacterized RDD family membrane protein YckC
MLCQQCGEPAVQSATACAKCGAALVAASSATSESITPAPTQDKPAVRRWVRFWARIFDVYAFALVVGFSSAFVAPHFFAQFNQIGLSMFMIFCWIFIESWLLPTFQTTPGKWLFKTKIALASGVPITYSKAQARSFKVWWRGMGVGFPLITTITLIMASVLITRNGITSWDREEGFIVSHETIGVPRILAAAVFFGFVLLLMFLGETAK